MRNVYTAVYICKVITPIGIPGYNDIVLGLPTFSNSDIVIQSTCTRFVVGKEYFIKITEQ